MYGVSRERKTEKKKKKNERSLASARRLKRSSDLRNSRKPRDVRHAISAHNETETERDEMRNVCMGPGIIWLTPLEACVFIRCWPGSAQLHRITSGNQPSWPELSAKCNYLPPPAPLSSSTYSHPFLYFYRRPVLPCTYFKPAVSVAGRTLAVLHKTAMNAFRDV